MNFLLQLGIKVKPGYMIIRIDEDERYYVVRKHFEERWKPLLWSRDGWSYEYSREEFEKSEYFLLRDSRSCGYPQPEEDFRYESISFDAEKICTECDCGRVQTNDLRVKKLSKHGFWTFFSWLTDEFFVSEKVYEEVFAPHGIEKRSVIKGGKVVDGVYQLVIPVIDEPLDLSDRDHWKCPVCGETKYTMNHHHYPFFPQHKSPLSGIYKTFDGQDILNGIDLYIEKNEFLTLLGPSGCGKTTLLNLIGGLDSYLSGSVEIDGEKITTNSDALRNRHIGYIFQNYYLISYYFLFSTLLSYILITRKNLIYTHLFLYLNNQINFLY